MFSRRWMRAASVRVRSSSSRSTRKRCHASAASTNSGAQASVLASPPSAWAAGLSSPANRRTGRNWRTSMSGMTLALPASPPAAPAVAAAAALWIAPALTTAPSPPAGISGVCGCWSARGGDSLGGRGWAALLSASRYAPISSPVGAPRPGLAAPKGRGPPPGDAAAYTGAVPGTAGVKPRSAIRALSTHPSSCVPSGCVESSNSPRTCTAPCWPNAASRASMPSVDRGVPRPGREAGTHMSSTSGGSAGTRLAAPPAVVDEGNTSEAMASGDASSTSTRRGRRGRGDAMPLAFGEARALP